MSGAAFLEQVRKLAEDVSRREGCSLYDLEFSGAGGARVLRVYIDKDGGPVSVEDCANVSKGMNLLLDVDDPIPGGAYQLEVSSPGLERVLKQPWHFEKALGTQVSLKSFAPLIEFNAEIAVLAKAKQIQGELSSVEAGGVRVKSPVGDVFVPFSAITKAHTVFEYRAPEKPGKSRSKN